MKRSPLRRHKRLVSRTPPPPVSKRRRREQRTRRANMLAVYGENPLCTARWDADCRGFADDAHEPGMRSRGADPTDPAQCIPICRPCHMAVHTNPAEATRRGLLAPSWEAA